MSMQKGLTLYRLLLLLYMSILIFLYLIIETSNVNVSQVHFTNSASPLLKYVSHLIMSEFYLMEGFYGLLPMEGDLVPNHL